MGQRIETAMVLQGVDRGSHGNKFVPKVIEIWSARARVGQESLLEISENFNEFPQVVSPRARGAGFLQRCKRLKVRIPHSSRVERISVAVYREPRPTVRPAPLHAPATAAHRRKVFPAERPRYSFRAFRH